MSSGSAARRPSGGEPAGAASSSARRAARRRRTGGAGCAGRFGPVRWRASETGASCARADPEGAAGAGGVGAIAYGEQKEMKRAVGDVVAMEKLSLAVSGSDIAAHAREVGLAEAVGAAPGGRAGGSR